MVSQTVDRSTWQFNISEFFLAKFLNRRRQMEGVLFERNFVDVGGGP